MAAHDQAEVIEQKIKRMNEKILATSSEYLFTWIPTLVMIHVVNFLSCNCNWMNTFPNRSENFGFSSRETVTELTAD